MKQVQPKRGRPQGESPEGLPSRLREARERKGWTITEAAEKLGVHKDTWAGWESKPTAIAGNLILDIARLLGVKDPKWFYT